VAIVIMRVNLLIVTGLAVAGFGLGLVGCKKAEQKSKIDPHSPEAVLRQVVDLGAVLKEGVRAKDFAYVNDRAYYLQGMAKALYAKLDAGEQQRLGRVFNDVTRVAEELDHAAGRRHEGATVASMEKLEGLLKELEAQFGTTRKR
jgi:hypothetical protein